MKFNFAAIALVLAFSQSTARADIFQWEYIDPADPTLGKQQSAVLCPDGSGALVEIGAALNNRDLTRAFLEGA